MMGLPSEDEWPQDSPISREAFENCAQPIIKLERLVRFTDSCAFELLQVSIFISFEFSIIIFLIMISHYYHSNKVFVQQQSVLLNIIFFDELIIHRVQ